MGLDRTLEERDISLPRKEPGSPIFLVLVVGLLLLLALQWGASTLQRSLYPFCSQFGDVTITFKDDVDGRDAQELAMPPGGSGLAAASFSLGQVPAYVTVAPEPPTTKQQLARYLSRFRNNPSVATIDGECAPRFSEKGALEERKPPFVFYVLEYSWAIFLILWPTILTRRWRVKGHSER